jgi:hypothetical protein
MPGRRQVARFKSRSPPPVIFGASNMVSDLLIARWPMACRQRSTAGTGGRHSLATHRGLQGYTTALCRNMDEFNRRRFLHLGPTAGAPTAESGAAELRFHADPSGVSHWRSSVRASSLVPTA